MAAKRTPAHRWLPGIATAALLSVAADTSAWSFAVNNLGQSAHQVNGYAICAA
jgi:hypothetical protein